MQRSANLTGMDLSRPPREVLQQGLDRTVELTGSAAGVVYLAKDEQLLPVAGNSVKLEAIDALTFGEGLPGQVAEERRSKRLSDVPNEEALHLHLGFARVTPQEVVALPLLLQERLLGVMLLAATTRYDDQALQDMDGLARQLALHFDYAQVLGQMERFSITDGLTGLFNRRYVTERLEVEFSRAFRYGSELSLLIMDLDHFRQINERFGQAVGDLALAEVSKLIRRSTRDSDLCGRYGGEEFIVVLPHTNQAQAGVVAEKIREAVAGAEISELAGEYLTISIGGACYPDSNALSLSELVQKTDEALAAAKSGGRNRSVIG